MRSALIIACLMLSINLSAFRLEIENEHMTVKAYTGFFQSRSLTGSVFSQSYTARFGKYPAYFSPLKLGIELYDRTRIQMTEFQLSNFNIKSFEDYGHKKNFSGFGFMYIKTESILHDIDDFLFHPYIGLMTSLNFYTMNMKAIRDGYYDMRGAATNFGLHFLIDMAFTINKKIEMDIKVPLRMFELNNSTIINEDPSLSSNEKYTQESRLDFLPFNLNVEFGIGWVIL